MKKILYILVCIVLTGILLYGVWFVYLWQISMPIYYFTKEANSYTANMYTADGNLGHTLIPNANGYYIWGYGDSVLINTDFQGFRMSNGNQDDGGLFFFGDSFTLCEELSTQDAYPYKVADSLCQHLHNAAVSGYGYAQMILKARTYVQRYDPEVVVFQVSPWLAERAVTPYMPALFFKVPSPYYNQQDSIVDPLYTSNVFELTQNQMLDKYRQGPISISDKFGFVWHFTRPVFQQQYWEETKLAFTLDSPVTQSLGDAEAATALAIQEIIRLSTNSKVVFLVVGYEQHEVNMFTEHYSQYFTDKVMVVNADAGLWSQPGITDKDAYERAYCFWHGDPPVLVDYHFNVHANQIITDALYKALSPQFSVCNE